MMYFWCSLCTLYLHACQVRVTVGDWRYLLLCLSDVFLAHVITPTTKVCDIKTCTKLIEFTDELHRVIRVHWRILQGHQSSLTNCTGSSEFTNKLYRVIRVHWQIVQGHENSLTNCTGSSKFTDELHRVIRVHWRIVQGHQSSLTNCTGSSEFTDQLYRVIRVRELLFLRPSHRSTYILLFLNFIKKINFSSFLVRTFLIWYDKLDGRTDVSSIFLFFL